MGGFWKDGTWAVWALLALFFLGVAVVDLHHYWHVEWQDLCNASETSGACVREWFGASSGYIAAIGALIAAAITVPHLRQQVFEARRQADFTAGEGEPTLDLLHDQDEPYYVVVRIVNWNRRALVLRRLRFDGRFQDARVYSIKLHQNDDETIARKSGHPPEFNPAIVLRGWEDRQKRPSFVHIKVEGYEPGWLPIHEIARPVSVYAPIELLGGTHRAIELEGHIV